jgi:membrane protein required for beta-lactamase induction
VVQIVNIKINFLKYLNRVSQASAGCDALADKCGPHDKSNACKEILRENLLVIIVLIFCFIIFIFQLYLWLGGFASP